MEIMYEQLSNLPSDKHNKRYLFNEWVEDDVGEYHEGATSVYETHDGKVVKAYSYDKNSEVTRKLKNEVTLLRRAQRLNRICHLKTPYVYMSEEVVVNDVLMKKYKIRNTIFYISMEKIMIPEKGMQNHLLEDKTFCKNVSRKFTKVSKCLAENRVHHNDYNDSNVRISNDGDIGLIDFGEASDVPGKHIMPLEIDCSKATKRKMLKSSPSRKKRKTTLR